jgi:hypothetical protein
VGSFVQAVVVAIDKDTMHLQIQFCDATSSQLTWCGRHHWNSWLNKRKGKKIMAALQARELRVNGEKVSVSHFDGVYRRFV